ncbi:MAG: hypothetical protein V1873_08520 [Verrucomicrobiota bacterium]
MQDAFSRIARRCGAACAALLLSSCRPAATLHLGQAAGPDASPLPLRVSPGARRVQIAGDQFCVDGVRFLIKASFYAYHPVGRNPWDVRPPPDVLRNHLRGLKAAGFNTIRWFEPTGPEIEICRQEGVFVFQQLWMDGNADYSDAAFRLKNLDRLREIVRGTRGHDNVLGYLVTNEPNLCGATTEREFRDVLSHLIEVRNMIREEDPGAYVSFDNWPPLVSWDHSMWDFVAFNVYTWGPITTTEHGMGYRPFLEYLKRTHASDRPLVILEYGASVCPVNRDGHGYGGWTEAAQARESLSMLRDILAAGSAGACYTHFADQIWKSGSNATREDDDPEEWFGMLALDLRGGPAMEGRWRPVYFALQEFHRAILLEPAPFSAVRGRQRVLVHSEQAAAARFRVGGGPWQKLQNEAGPWWAGTLDTTRLEDALQRVEVQVESGGGTVSREAWVVVANRRPDPFALDVKLTPSRDSLWPGEPLAATVTVRRADGSPAAGQLVRWAVHEHRAWPFKPRTATTGPDGTVALDVDTQDLLGLVTISAGVDVSDGPYQRRFGDLATVRIGMR